MLKSAVRTLIRELIDDPDGARWSNASLDLLTDLYYKRLWADILDVRPQFLVATENITTITSPGYIDLEETGSGGDLANSIFRIMKVKRNDFVYNELSEYNATLDSTNSEVVTGPDYSYLKRVEKLYLFPLDTTDAVEITYSYYPASYDSLSDAAVVPWVENHYDALIWGVAAQGLLKGAAEDNQLLYYQAKDAREIMLRAVQKAAAGPTVMWHFDDGPEAWGSV